MSLEDHVGDIAAKARQNAGLSARKLAEAMGAPLDAWVQFEASGQPLPGVDLKQLAELLGLAPEKLEAIASGWQPAPWNPARWRRLVRIPCLSGGYAANAYLAWDETTREAALIDAGFDGGEAIERIEREGLRLKHILITHRHGDHLGGVDRLRRRFPEARVHGPSPSAAEEDGEPLDLPVRLGPVRFELRPTPGHTPDSATYVASGWPGGAPAAAFVGDALFAGSIGRAAAPRQALRAIRKQILSLPDETLICPGHGPPTTVGEEKAHNPFF